MYNGETFTLTFSIQGKKMLTSEFMDIAVSFTSAVMEDLRIHK